MMIKPIYIVNGLLDSGKTSVIKETLLNPNFNEGERTLIIIAEEGEIEYEQAFLDESNSFLLKIDSIKDLTHDYMSEIDNIYDFDRIFLECNGLEDESILLDEGTLIENWEIAQVLTIFDASLFKIQNQNLRQFIYNHIKISECCIFNRLKDDNDYLYIRNNVKAINARVELIFEDINHEIVEFNDVDIFDLTKELLEISDHDYGIWYMDAANNPLKYEGCNIALNMQFLEDLPEYENALIMGRKAMVCCADDIAPIGLTLIGVDKKMIDPDKYYCVKAKIHCIDDEEGYKTCLLYVDQIEEIQKPQDELVYFN